MTKNLMGISKLIEAAEKEDWDFIDTEIPKIASDPEVISWAVEAGVKHEDSNVRDLAVSIIEKAGMNPQRFANAEPILYDLMKRDNNPYVKYRSAFALAAHDSTKDRDQVIGMLQEALRDEDTKGIAESYLDAYKK